MFPRYLYGPLGMPTVTLSLVKWNQNKQMFGWVGAASKENVQ